MVSYIVVLIYGVLYCSIQYMVSYTSSLSSIAKALTVLMLLRASSATDVAMATYIYIYIRKMRFHFFNKKYVNFEL